MCNNFYLQEKRIEEHVRDLQREASQQRIVAAGLPRNYHHVGKHMLSSLGTRLVALGTWLERVEQRDNVLRPVTSTLQQSNK